MRTIPVTKMSTEGVSKALRAATTEPVLVSRDGEPYVFIVDARKVLEVERSLGTTADVATRSLLAVDLFDHGVLTFGRAARLAGLDLGDFIDLCDRLQVPVLREPAEGLAAEAGELSTWLDEHR